ncbi:MAG: hypothetical protein ACT4PT_07960 [Methanobacteriota archaeon]
MSFLSRLRGNEGPSILYEVIPPPQSAPREEVVDIAVFVKTLLSEHRIDAINIPEVRDESGKTARVGRFMAKSEPRQFGAILHDLVGSDVEVIANRCVAYEPSPEQEEWFEVTYAKFGVRGVVLVGPESSKDPIVGPSVAEGARLARGVAERVLGAPDAVAVGAITIPTRRRPDFDEPERLVAKAAAGVEFFTSQVIFEPDSTKRLLSDYDALCKRQGVEPKPIFLSFAPVTGRKDAEFLAWLGAKVPAPTLQWILDAPRGATERSARVAEHVLREILVHAHERGLSVPIGLNVEHVMRYNVDASEILLDRLESLLAWRKLETS